jgi:DDE superfamily endonuclease
LSIGDKCLNHLISSVRIIVEHVIAGVKRCRIVKDVLRLTKAGIADMVMEIACGLHNLRVSCRHPLPTFSSSWEI